MISSTPLKKVLIITYYWPPAGGPGVQRVLKFAKYLPEFGWQPSILTVKNGEYPAIDISLQKEIPVNCKVYNTFSLEPNFVYKKFTGMGSDEKIPTAVLAAENTNWKKRLANWIRLNLFIPDAKIGWISFAVRKGKKIIKAERPDIIFSSSPPPTVHLIARKLSKWSGIKWVADFRDPWTDIYHYDRVNYSRFADLLNKIKERNVLKNLDGLTIVSTGLVRLLDQKVNKPLISKIIPNGYDQDDFAYISQSKKSNKFTIAYAGKITDQQNPINFWKAIRKIVCENQNFRETLEILLIGKIAPSIIEHIRENSLNEYLVTPGYLEHTDVLKRLNAAEIMLLLIPDTDKNEGILTGKLFEYLALKKFILGFGPIKGNAAKILKRTKCGEMLAYSNFEGITNLLEARFIAWEKGEYFSKSINKNEILKYDRKQLTSELAEFLQEIYES